jgi:ribosomal protein S18 acetylase RimI-like enzyme
MRAVTVREKGKIERFLRQDPYLHLYEIGDLDDLYFGRTAWYALEDGGEVRALALLYTGTSMPVVLALAGEPVDAVCALLQEIRGGLPGSFYAHFSPGVAGALSASHRIEPHGTFLKMALTEPKALDAVETDAVSELCAGDIDELHALYEASYPGHWFEPAMLAAGHYYGLRLEGALVSVAGIHVFSHRYRVAALGNITTHPRVRGRGLARRVTVKLCQELLGSVDHIGLNVKGDNAGAIACYERLGFRPWAVYEECSVVER